MDAKVLIDEMISEGVEPEVARAAVIRVQARIRSADRKRGFTNLMFGLLIFAIGAGVTYWTFTSMSDVYILAYGALIVGPILALVGVAQLAAAGKDSQLARMGVGL